MVIDSNNSINTTSQGTKNRPAVGDKPADAKTGTQPPPPQANDVSLSSKAQQLSRIEVKISDVPEVDSDRVAELKKAIEDGSFNVNPERVAEAMLKHDDLFGG